MNDLETKIRNAIALIERLEADGLTVRNRCSVHVEDEDKVSIFVSLDRSPE